MNISGEKFFDYYYPIKCFTFVYGCWCFFLHFTFSSLSFHTIVENLSLCETKSKWISRAREKITTNRKECRSSESNVNVNVSKRAEKKCAHIHNVKVSV